MVFGLRREGDSFRGEIPGPYRAGQGDTLREPFELLPGESGAATLRLQGQSLTVKDGEWSDWVKLQFALGTFQSQKVNVVTRVLYRKHPDGKTSLYVSPLNFDPANPLYAISSPKSYAPELAGHVGCFHTRGMPYDTQALNDGVISDADFLAQWRTIMDEDERMLLHELGRFGGGMLFSYFEGPDILQHMFWRGIDDKHPLHGAADTAANRGAILECYQRCDAILGRARAALGGEGTIVVLSDHGFAPFRRAVHVNAILREAGYLSVKSGTRSGELFESLDWPRTRAYAVGFNAVYLNRAGREGQGTVPADDARSVIEALAKTLEQFTDPDTGERPIKKVYVLPISETNSAVSPDLIVGYARGYRASWEAALGGVPEKTVEPNTRKWSGDHCIDPSEVPGIFLCSDPKLDAAALVDVTAAVGRHMAH
jgi:predicted AlkP superfamily phosphohydrolase/phosphomutase